MNKPIEYVTTARLDSDLEMIAEETGKAIAAAMDKLRKEQLTPANVSRSLFGATLESNLTQLRQIADHVLHHRPFAISDDRMASPALRKALKIGDK